MTLSEITQLLGGIGVIASLIYVAIQIRNNARAVRAAAYRQLALTTAGQWDTLFGSEELCSLVLRGCDDFSALNRVEKARFRFMLMAFMRRFENGWFQHKIGTLKSGDWQAVAADMDSLFSLPGPQAAWPLIKTRSNPEFRAFVDDLAKRQAPIAAKHVPSGPVVTKRRTKSAKA
jgi:hypothetical protein